MPHPLNGAVERLKRAEQNISNLNWEIDAFRKESPYPSVYKNDNEAVKEFNNYWSVQTIPPRFGVLISEVLHHYRATLDSLIWECLRGRTIKNPNQIEFPITECEPFTKDEVKRFRGKIKGIDPAIQTVIKSLQPYQRIYEPNTLLLVIHNMNRFDKHRELTILTNQTSEVREITLGTLSDKARTITLPSGTKMYMAEQFIPQIAFREFDDKRNWPACIRSYFASRP
jgi:hypothetical protein